MGWPPASVQSEGQGGTTYVHYAGIWTLSHDLSAASAHPTITLYCLMGFHQDNSPSNASVFDFSCFILAQSVMEENQAGKAKSDENRGGAATGPDAQ